MSDQHFEILLHLALLIHHLLAFFLQHSVTLLENKNYLSQKSLIFLRQHFTCLWIGRHLWTSCGPHFCSAIFRNSFSRCFFCNCSFNLLSTDKSDFLQQKEGETYCEAKLLHLVLDLHLFRLVIINQRKEIKEKEITKNWSQSTYFPNRNLQ